MKAVARIAVAIAACALSSAAAAAVVVGHSGWFWGNPLPQGNTLRAVVFAGSRGYAVGDFGTVMRTDDGGNTWIGVTTGTTATLSLVDMISPDSIVIGGECTVQRSDDAGRSFVTLPWTPPGSGCRARLRAVVFPSSDVGYLLLSDGTVLRTRDGGQTWVGRTAIPGTAAAGAGSRIHATDIQFPSQDMGIATTEAGALYRTTDSGISWALVAAAPQHLDSISFPDALTGYAAGGASVLKTEDGGLTWTQRGVVMPPDSIAWIRCADALRCVAVTTRGNELLRTDDGGSTWTSISPSSDPLFAASYSGAGTMVAVGEAGATVASADGGHNFAEISDAIRGRFTGLTASSPLVAYAYGRAGALARTVDGGEDWSQLTAPVADTLADVAFPTTRTGYGLDRQGTLVRTDDGGSSWQLLDTGTYLTPRAVIAPDPDVVLLVGPRGIRRSADGGSTFARIRQGPVAKLALVGGGAVPGVVYAYGAHAIVFSADGGKTWRASTLPNRGKELVKVDFATASIVYALSRNGRLWKSRDSGLSWREVASIGTQLGTDISFSDPANGYVAVSQFGDDVHGYVMRTSDGGIHWRPQLVDRVAIRAGALAAPSARVAYAVSGADHLLATDSGGDIGQRSTIDLSVQRRRPGKPGVIALSGQLTPARGGETVVVWKREIHGQWVLRDVTVSSTGHFTVFSQLRRTTRFVAQWSGDDTRAGAGSALLTVPVAEPARPK